MLRHWLSKLCALLLAISPASAQEFFPSYGFGLGGTHAAAVACSSTPITYLSTQTSTVDSTSYTFNSVAIGDPPCGANSRVIVMLSGCLTVTSTSTVSGTVNGNAVSELGIDSSSTRTQASQISVPTGTTANFVWTYSGAADNTCERFILVLWAVITSSTTAVDYVQDVSATGDFDLANVAVTSGGGEAVGIIASSSSTCDAFDALFSGTETVTEDGTAVVEATLAWRAGHFTADSTATDDDYTNLSCGTETDGMAMAVSFAPPT